MLGGPAKLTELKAIADKHGIPLVEDCAQAFGATYQGVGVGGIGAAGVYSFNEYKTITCGDGGMIVTDDEALYERCFAMHDQGHAPDRLESKYAPRPFLGMNFRMTELSGRGPARPGAQAGHDHRRTCGPTRRSSSEFLEEEPAIDFRTLPDPAGDLATHLVVVLPSAEIASNVAREVGSITLSESGWHVYSKMNHLLERRTVTGKGCPFDCDIPGHTHGDYRVGHAAPDGRASWSVRSASGSGSATRTSPRTACACATASTRHGPVP